MIGQGLEYLAMTLRRLRRFIALPPGDFGSEQRLAERLHAIILSFLGIMVVLTIIYLLFRIQPLLVNIGITGGSALLFAVMLLFVRRGNLRIPGALLIVYLYTATTAVALSFDGIHDTSLVVYFLLIAISGLTLGARAALLASIFSALGLAFVYGIDVAQGGIEGPQQPPYLRVVEMGGLLLIMGVVLRLTITDLRDALERARRENAERRAAQKALARARDELEERVTARTAELARANQDLNTLIQSSHSGILFITPERRLAVINSRALELLALAGDVDDWQGRSTESLLASILGADSHRWEETRRQLRELGRDDGETKEGELNIDDRYLSWQATRVAFGEESGTLLMIYDVSAEREAEQMRHDLINGMVHDLRNPLSGMLNVLSLLKLLDEHQKETMTGRQKHYVGQLTDSVEHMARLVNNILDVSRLESGQMSLQRAAVPVDELVAETIEAQQPLAAAKQVSLDSAVAPGLPAISADRAMMERVLQNLVDNAIKFAPSGSSVLVAAEPQKPGLEPANAVRLLVHDSGPGIAPDLEPRLFQKFASGNQKGSGSGLGLAFCRLAVEAHGGRLWLAKERTPGTTFAFTIPTAMNGNSPTETDP